MIGGDGSSGGGNWRKSSFSAEGNCVEVRRGDGTWQLRHSRDPDGAVLTFTDGEFRAFALALEAGEFHRARW